MRERPRPVAPGGSASLAALAILALGGCGAPASSSGAEAAHANASAAAVADFTLDGIDGRPYSLSDYVGRDVVLVAFWATWCEPCKRKTVQHQGLYEKYRARGFTVLAVSMDEPETQGQVRLFARQRGLTFPVLLDTESEAVQQLNPRRTAPFTVLLGRDGRIAWAHEGWVPGDERTLEEEIAEALAAPPAAERGAP